MTFIWLFWLTIYFIGIQFQVPKKSFQVYRYTHFFRYIYITWPLHLLSLCNLLIFPPCVMEFEIPFSRCQVYKVDKIKFIFHRICRASDQIEISRRIKFSLADCTEILIPFFFCGDFLRDSHHSRFAQFFSICQGNISLVNVKGDIEFSHSNITSV